MNFRTASIVEIATYLYYCTTPADLIAVCLATTLLPIVASVIVFPVTISFFILVLLILLVIAIARSCPFGPVSHGCATG
jgi:hypothetical protein